MLTSNNISCTSCTNNNCLIKKSCPTSILNEVTENKNFSFYRKKQIIFHEGNESYNVYFIHSGLIKVFKNGAFNKSQIVRFSTNGNILGHRALTQSSIYPISASAIVDSEICSFSRKFFFELLNKVPQLSINLMLFFAQELNEEETKLRDMAVLNVREKVAKSLLYLINNFNLNERNEINKIELLSRQDIAEVIGLTPNQITKELACLKNEGLIDINRKYITISSVKAIENILPF